MGADDATSTHDDHVEPDSRPAPNDDSANSGEPSRKDRFLTKWRAVPTPLRKTVVLVIGATLLCIGGVLVVLHPQPGPLGLRHGGSKHLPGLHQPLAQALRAPFGAAFFHLRRGKKQSKAGVGKSSGNMAPSQQLTKDGSNNEGHKGGCCSR